MPTLIKSPFKILVDNKEGYPYWFENIRVRSSRVPYSAKKKIKAGDSRDFRWDIETEFVSLGNSRGDYSIEGMQDNVGIERKSKDDAYGTFLAFGDRKRRFEIELETISQFKCSAVVIECSFGELLADVSQPGKKTREQNRAALAGQILAWQQDFKVPWIFCQSRRHAEITTFRIMQRFHGKKVKEMKKIEKELASL